MKKVQHILLLALCIFFCSLASAHFGMLIPSDSMVMQDDNRTLGLELSFSHPFELVGMNMEKPVTFGVLVNGKKTDLLPTLKSTKVMEHPAWQTQYKIQRPGAYQFYMEPKPYWEPAEDCFIIHYTKTVVAAFGDDSGWDAEIGLPAEIIPLSRPFGLYKGNVFQGIVKVKGKPVPFAEVEVEYYNQQGKAQAENNYMITQTVKADKNGVFTYSPPRSGWWGFAALSTADEKLKHDGEEKDIEIGAVLWVEFIDWKETYNSPTIIKHKHSH
jgi:nickel transport protein